MQHCFGPAEILLPKEEIPLEQWACLACDQFTSQPEYWQKARQAAGSGPSALDLVLPEAFLGAPDEAQRIGAVHAAMQEYRASVLTRTVKGYVYLERRTQSGVRQGLVGVVDLEAYSCRPGAESPVRPTEQTVPERIPPRLAVRRGASLETPHVMLLLDDAERPVLAPLAGQKARMRPVYAGSLMLGGGSVEGWAVEEPALVEELTNAIADCGSQAAFDRRWPAAAGRPPLAIAVGDGNHSLATAKACWEELKASLPAKEQETHPARFCLAELCSLHSPAIGIEPIHRVLFGANYASVLLALTEYSDYTGAGLCAGARAAGCPQTMRILCGGREVPLGFAHPHEALAVGTIEAFVQRYLSGHVEVQADYVHGEEAVRALAQKGAVAFLLPPFAKSDIFKGVVQGGVLPRKSFSMGHAEEKRYYLECRSLVPAQEPKKS